jgi:hypothetical protein
MDLPVRQRYGSSDPTTGAAPKGWCKNNFTDWVCDCVVPFGQDLVRLQAQCPELKGGFGSRRIVAAVEVSGDRQPRLGSGGADEAQEFLILSSDSPAQFLEISERDGAQ